MLSQWRWLYPLLYQFHDAIATLIEFLLYQHQLLVTTYAHFIRTLSGFAGSAKGLLPGVMQHSHTHWQNRQQTTRTALPHTNMAVRRKGCRDVSVCTLPANLNIQGQTLRWNNIKTKLVTMVTVGLSDFPARVDPTAIILHRDRERGMRERGTER